MFLFVKSIHIKNRENKTQFKMIETDTKQIFEKPPKNRIQTYIQVLRES